MLSIAATFVSLIALLASAQGPGGGRGTLPAPLVRDNATEKISEHVYVIPDNNVVLVPNIGIIVGSRATLVVDTGMGTRNGQTVMREVEKVSKNADLYLVTTHIHPEHDLGAAAFPPHTKVIRAQAQVTEISETGLDLAKRFSGFSPMNAELLAGAEFRKADITFDREHTVDLGGVRARLIAMGNNHTRGDTAIFIEPDGVLFSGDVTMPGLPAIAADASIRLWLTSQQRLAALRPKRVVPSHGAIGDASMIANYKTFFDTIMRRVAELKKQGKSADEAASTIQGELKQRFGDSPRIAAAVRTAYVQTQ